MRLRSALEDVTETTLASLAGDLRRLEYLATLLGDDQTYNHWGLARTYGKQASQDALEQAHRKTLNRVLAQPLHVLLTEMQAMGAKDEVQEYLDGLEAQAPRLLPQNSGKASGLHLRSVLHALSALLHSESPASR
jgi:hypothetical protein